MTDKKYELVAFTRNVTDPENTTLHMITELELELLRPTYDKIEELLKEEQLKQGIIDADLARKYIEVYEECARLEILLGHPKDGLHFLCRAREYAALKRSCSNGC